MDKTRYEYDTRNIYILRGFYKILIKYVIAIQTNGIDYKLQSICYNIPYGIFSTKDWLNCYYRTLLFTVLSHLLSQHKLIIS